MTFGLYYYDARWYDLALGRFIFVFSIGGEAIEGLLALGIATINSALAVSPQQDEWNFVDATYLNIYQGPPMSGWFPSLVSTQPPRGFWRND